MKSSIRVEVEFSFKGENYVLSASVNLDEMLSKYGIVPSFHGILAKNNDIDTYSYPYEVMEEADLEFSDATGLASRFLKDGRFDLEGFSRKWKESRMLDLLRPIAKRVLDADLDSDPKLREAMLEAYNSGRESGEK